MLLKVLLGIVIALLLVVAGLLAKLYQQNKYSTDPSPTGLQAASKLRERLEALQRDGVEPTETDCKEMRDFLATASSGGVNDLVLDPLETAMDQLCDD